MEVCEDSGAKYVACHTYVTYVIGLELCFIQADNFVTVHR